MIANLKSPSPELKEPIVAHFRSRKTAILNQVQGWASDSRNSARHASSMALLYAELETAIAKYTA